MERIKDILVSPDISIKDALKRMDAAAKKILFVVKPISQDKNRMLGVVTDGDIRRWILQGNSLDKSVINVMNKKPRLLLENQYSNDNAKQTMLVNKIECLPIVDAQGNVVSAVWWLDFFDKGVKKNTAIKLPVIIMAGGEGTRLYPFTNILPKPLIPIGEKPIVELIMDKFMEFGCDDFYLSVNYKANILKAYFNEHQHHYDIKYIHEDKPLGTIGSLSLLQDKMKDAFFVTNCDILIEADYYELFKFHKDNKNSITLVVSLKHYKIPYGICEIKNGGTLRNIKEKPEFDFLVNTGLYILEPEVLRDIPEGSFYNMTDLLEDYIKRDMRIGIYPVSEKSWIDLGQLSELQENLQRFEGKNKAI